MPLQHAVNVQWILCDNQVKAMPKPPTGAEFLGDAPPTEEAGQEAPPTEEVPPTEEAAPLLAPTEAALASYVSVTK